MLASCEGLLPNSTDAPPALVLGGGPAGVVEFPKKFVVDLLVGVVVVIWPAEDVFEPELPKEKAPALPALLNEPGVCPVVVDSGALLGVEKPVNPDEGAALLEDTSFCSPACPPPKSPPGVLLPCA